MISSIKAWCYRSETIFWARLQVVAGAIWTVLLVTDLSPILPANTLTYWMIGSGVVTELLRRRGAEVNDSGKLVPKE